MPMVHSLRQGTSLNFKIKHFQTILLFIENMVVLKLYCILLNAILCFFFNKFASLLPKFIMIMYQNGQFYSLLITTFCRSLFLKRVAHKSCFSQTHPPLISLSPRHKTEFVNICSLRNGPRHALDRVKTRPNHPT